MSRAINWKSTNCSVQRACDWLSVVVRSMVGASKPDHGLTAATSFTINSCMAQFETRLSHDTGTYIYIYVYAHLHIYIHIFRAIRNQSTNTSLLMRRKTAIGREDYCSCRTFILHDQPNNCR